MRRKFCVLNLRGPTPTVKLSENKTRAKLPGSMVCYLEDACLSTGCVRQRGTCVPTVHVHTHVEV